MVSVVKALTVEDESDRILRILFGVSTWRGSDVRDISWTIQKGFTARYSRGAFEVTASRASHVRGIFWNFGKVTQCFTAGMPLMGLRRGFSRVRDIF